MLNKKKQIITEIKKNQTPSFFNLPVLPVNSYLQTNSNVRTLEDLNLTFHDAKAEILLNNCRFSFSSKIYRTTSLLTKYTRKKVLNNKDLKKSLLFFNKLYVSSKKYPLFFIKQIKGGFMTRSLGIQTFMPRSHRLTKKEANNKQILLRIKALQRKKKYSSKTFLKINMVSSAKNAKSSLKVFSRKNFLKKNFILLKPNKK
jgi:hypothetical protein